MESKENNKPKGKKTQVNRNKNKKNKI